MRKTYRMPVSNVTYTNVIVQSQCTRILLTEQRDGTEAPKNYIGFRATATDSTVVFDPGAVIEILPPASKPGGYFDPTKVVGQVITISGAKNQFPAASNLDQVEY